MQANLFIKSVLSKAKVLISGEDKPLSEVVPSASHEDHPTDTPHTVGFHTTKQCKEQNKEKRYKQTAERYAIENIVVK